MSLFHLREFWNAPAGAANDICDYGCLAVGSLLPGTEQVIVGTYSGLLRIFQPKLKGDGFSSSDMLLEMQMKEPILQVEAGRFVAAVQGRQCVAVLHPRKLLVCGMTATTGKVSHGDHYTVTSYYEHNLDRSSFNFCYGPFGGVREKDLLLVQSLDGAVTILEQEGAALTRFLPDGLVPGPLRYSATSDSFVTVASSRELQSYRYQVVAVASDQKGSSKSAGKRVTADWRVVLGEAALNVEVLPGHVLVLGERTLFCVSENGQLRWLKKLDVLPVCMAAIGVREGRVQSVLCTHGQMVDILADGDLRWAARCSLLPVQIRVFSTGDLRGLLCLVDESGRVVCAYLGSEPAILTPMLTEAREVDFGKMEHELRAVHRKIKEQSDPGVLPAQEKCDVSMQASVRSVLDQPSRATDGDAPSVTVTVTIRGRELQGVRISVSPPFPFTCNRRCTVLSLVRGSAQLELVFWSSVSCTPGELSVQCVAQFESGDAPRFASVRFELPFALSARPCAPQKQASCKLTLDVNRTPKMLDQLFPEMQVDGDGTTMAVQFAADAQVTVLTAKNSNRYRAQSDSFSALALLVAVMVDRLQAAGFEVAFTGALPLPEYFALIEEHLQSRQKCVEYEDLLSKRAHQFRVIQKRLLTRFKDKQPSALSNLDSLLEGTYRQLLALADAVEHFRFEELSRAAAVAAGTRLILSLASVSYRLRPEESRELSALLHPSVCVSRQQGWEELVDTALTHALRTTLSKASKDNLINPGELSMPKDPSKVTKHIGLVLDKLAKGARFSSAAKSTVDKREAEPTTTTFAPNKRPKGKQTKDSKQGNTPRKTTANDDDDEGVVMTSAGVHSRTDDSSVPDLDSWE